MISRNIFDMSDKQLWELHNELTLIAGKLGYASWTVVVFNPIKRMNGKEQLPCGTLSGFINDNDIYKFGNILIQMLHTLADRGYVKRIDHIDNIKEY